MDGILIRSCILVLAACIAAGCTSPTGKLKPAQVPVPRGDGKTALVAPKRGDERAVVPEPGKPFEQSPPVPVPPPARTPAPSATPPGVAPLATRLAARLRSRLLLVESESGSLTAGYSGKSSPPSLFEEAIALNKVRAALKKTSGIVAGSPSRTTMKSGTVTLSIDPAAPDQGTAGLVENLLTIEGVQKVRVLVP